jgi:putative endonuclease
LREYQPSEFLMRAILLEVHAPHIHICALTLKFCASAQLTNVTSSLVAPLKTRNFRGFSLYVVLLQTEISRMFTVYILYLALSKKIYIGQTSNLIQRFYSHNFFGHDWSKRYRPWVVIYCEYYFSKTEALRREKALKSNKGREWIWQKIKIDFKEQGFISVG